MAGFEAADLEAVVFEAADFVEVLRAFVWAVLDPAELPLGELELGE